jgi:hypothetical protein
MAHEPLHQKEKFRLLQIHAIAAAERMQLQQ